MKKHRSIQSSHYSRLSSTVPTYVVDVGWDQRNNSYYIDAYDAGTSNDRSLLNEDCIVLSAGHEHHAEIPTVVDLLQRSWGLVVWSDEMMTLRKLMSDPLRELSRNISTRTSERLSRDDLPYGLREIINAAFN